MKRLCLLICLGNQKSYKTQLSCNLKNVFKKSPVILNCLVSERKIIFIIYSLIKRPLKLMRINFRGSIAKNDWGGGPSKCEKWGLCLCWFKGIMEKPLMDLQLKFQVFEWSDIADNGFRHIPPTPTPPERECLGYNCSLYSWFTDQKMKADLCQVSVSKEGSPFYLWFPWSRGVWFLEGPIYPASNTLQTSHGLLGPHLKLLSLHMLNI